jgi:hypothetical protein
MVCIFCVISTMELLNKEFGPGLRISQNENHWSTPYGVTFITLNNASYYYKYDDDIEFPFEGNSHLHGFINTNELASIIDQLKKNPMKLRTKSLSVTELEKLTGLKAKRIDAFFGVWQISSEKFSMLNNDFNKRGICSRGENNYELYVKETGECHEYVTIEQARQLLGGES